MPAFLVITILSLAFYLGLLVFLYWDGRKRRSSGNPAYKVQAGSVVELGALRGKINARPSPRRQTAAVLVRFAANPGHSGLKSHLVQGGSRKVITLPAIARDHDDAQCG